MEIFSSRSLSPRRSSSIRVGTATSPRFIRTASIEGSDMSSDASESDVEEIFLDDEDF